MTITAEGSTVVVLPRRAPARAAAELVAHHAGWIERHVGILQAQRRQLASRPRLGEGRTIDLQGIPHAVRVLPMVGRRRSSVELDDDRLTVTIRLADLDPRPANAVLEAWLRALARRWLAERVSEMASPLGVSVTRITVRDQRTRWASASHAGTLSFNWRLVLCPRDVFDYVVVHELAHLAVRGHSDAFWRLVERHAPQAWEARRWLRGNHQRLRHALD